MSDNLNDTLEINPKGEDVALIRKRYPALRTIAGVYKVLAYIWLVITIIGAIIGLVIVAVEDHAEFRGIGLGVFLYSVICGAFGFIGLLAVSEIIKIFIDVEENTRLTNDFLRKFTNKSNV